MKPEEIDTLFKEQIKTLDDSLPDNGFDKEVFWNDLQKNLKPKRKKVGWIVWAGAATILLTITTAVLLMIFSVKTNTPVITKITPDEISKPLPDSVINPLPDKEVVVERIVPPLPKSRKLPDAANEMSPVKLRKEEITENMKESGTQKKPDSFPLQVQKLLTFSKTKKSKPRFPLVSANELTNTETKKALPQPEPFVKLNLSIFQNSENNTPGFEEPESFTKPRPKPKN